MQISSKRLDLRYFFHRDQGQIVLKFLFSFYIFPNYEITCFPLNAIISKRNIYVVTVSPKCSFR
jgi:hypothetical protein